MTQPAITLDELAHKAPTLSGDRDVKRTMVKVDLGSLIIDPQVQRGLDQGRVAAIAGQFLPEALGVLTISLRDDGTRAVIDGQHRHAAAAEKGYDGQVDAVQYQGLTLADEAVLFLTLNNTKSVTPLDKFKARVLAGDPDAVAIRDIMTRAGWRVQTAKGDWGVSAIAAVERVYTGKGLGVPRNVDGAMLLGNVFNVLNMAWNGQAASSHSTIIGALGKFLGWHGDKLDYARLSHGLSQLKPMNLVADIRATKDMQRVDLLNAGARILTGVYNNRMRNGRLPEWQHR